MSETVRNHLVAGLMVVALTCLNVGLIATDAVSAWWIPLQVGLATTCLLLMARAAREGRRP